MNRIFVSLGIAVCLALGLVSQSYACDDSLHIPDAEFAICVDLCADSTLLLTKFDGVTLDSACALLYKWGEEMCIPNRGCNPANGSHCDGPSCSPAGDLIYDPWAWAYDSVSGSLTNTLRSTESGCACLWQPFSLIPWGGFYRINPFSPERRDTLIMPLDLASWTGFCVGPGLTVDQEPIVSFFDSDSGIVLQSETRFYPNMGVWFYFWNPYHGDGDEYWMTRNVTAIYYGLTDHNCSSPNDVVVSANEDETTLTCIAPDAGRYQVFGTTDPNQPFEPLLQYWHHVLTFDADVAGQVQTSFPTPVDENYRYVVVHVCE